MDAVLKSRIYLIATTAFCSIIYATVVEASPDTYLGCYDESGKTEIFVHTSGIRITDLPDSRPDGCRERCRKNLTDSYSFAGLWGGTYCYCATSLLKDQIAQIDNSVCSVSCPGAPTEFCGGSNASYIFSVYSVCSKELYGSQCKKNCNCKENRNCTVNGICPHEECAVGWKLSGLIMYKRICSVDINECKTECNSTNSINCHNCSLALHQQCNNLNGSFECICDNGFNKTSHGICTDIDECALGTHNCSQLCNNTVGSFTCSCSSGYELQGLFSCIDIDECTRTHNCSQSCNNTEGSYNCSCRSGFKLDGRFNCIDIDECAENLSNCTHNCTNTRGSYKCSCRTGYELDSNGYSCKDINECQKGTSNCSHNCTNNEGSYECTCNTGFERDSDGHRCNDIDECDRRMSKCNQNCNNTVGSYKCSCYTGGYRLQNEFNCTDINECTEGSSKCNQSCHNAIGNYSCSCSAEYELDGDGYRCNDIDECELKISKCNQNCSNTVGSYNCSCYTRGYRLQNEFSCIDVNECDVGNGGCHHYCNNTDGSFVCSCSPGYRIAVRSGESYNCTEVDECAEGTSGCDHNCNNTDGGYNCSCRSGYQLKSDLHICDDVDECKGTHKLCDHICNNQMGSYSCSCNAGSYLHGTFECKKELTGTILGVVLAVLIIWILVMVIILLIAKRVYPFNHPRIINTFWKKEPDAVPSENGTKDQLELKKTPAKSGTHEGAMKKSKKTCIAVKDLKKYIEKIRSNGGFEEEFRSIPMVSDLSYEFAQSQALKPKNRFKNILPYDDNRVILDEVNNDPLTTYINASIIKGYSPQDKIIASHGPTPNTLTDFWRMIWQYEVAVIVMVTKCMEDAKRKCEQYWPLEGSMDSDEITISMLSTENWPDYIITRLKVTKESTSRQLVHLLFTAWPDHGAPDHATSLLSFRRAVKNVIVADKFFLVHCSAGVGRTGTFLAIDFLLQQAKDKGSVDVYKYLEGLRDQRMHAVQTLDQYEFIHQAVLEAVTLGETVASCKALSEHRKHLNSLNLITGKTYIQTEFDMLQEMHPPLSEETTSAALDKENVSRNRNTKLVPGDVNRVLLRDTDTECNYINAVYVSSYRHKDAFISAELPLTETLKDFWTMVVDYKCKLVAFLDTSGASDDLNNHLLVPGKTKLLFARKTVWTHSFEAKKLSDYCNSYFVAVANPPDDDEDIYANAEEIPSFKVPVLHFQLTRRLAQTLPEVNELIKTSLHNIKSNGPIVIVSRDGVNPTGQYIAFSNLMEMATSQHEVDVFNAVHNIKKTQPYFITSLDDYQMIFDALEAEGDTSTYANI